MFVVVEYSEHNRGIPRACCADRSRAKEYAEKNEYALQRAQRHTCFSPAEFKVFAVRVLKSRKKHEKK